MCAAISPIQRIVTELPGPKAQELLSRDQQVISPAPSRPYPFVMDHGRGVEVWDVDGNRFLDFTAGIGVTATGHCHPRVVQAIKDAADQFIHISSDYYHELQVKLGERLGALAPMREPGMTFFTNSGTEAVEGAIKLARFVTGRPRFIGFLGAFHGRTMGSLAFTASKHTQREGFFPTMPGVEHVPFPNPYRPLFRGDDQGLAVLDYIENVLFKTSAPPQEIAAIVLEPIQGEGGYIVPPDSFLPGLRQLCDRHDILLVVDEIQSGIGRTGQMFAVQHWNVQPDIMTLAKGLGSGMPIGAFVARKSLMEQWFPGAHGNTYGGNPLACAAALTTLDLVETEYVHNARQMGDYLLGRLREIQARHPVIGNVRGKGLMIGLELVEDHDSQKPAVDFLKALIDTAFRQGLLLLPCGESTLRLIPPLMLPREAADEALDLLELSFNIVEDRLG